MNDNHEFQQERLYSCIGKLVVSWGHLELWLDFTIAHIHESLGGKSLQPGKPRMLEAKLAYLRRMARER